MILLACSGFDGPPEALVRNIEFANQHAAIAACLCLASLALFIVKRTWWALPASSVAMFAMHPAWTEGGLHGDCGYLMRHASWAVTSLGVVFICLQLARIVWIRAFLKPAGQITP